MKGFLGYLLLCCPLLSVAYEPDPFGTGNTVVNVSPQALGATDPCSLGPIQNPLSLADVIERIICHDPDIRQAWANARVQAAQVGISQADYLPRLDGTVGNTYGLSDIHYEDSEYLSREGHRRRVTNTLSLSWVLFDFGRRDAALRKSRQLLVAANAGQDAALQKTFVLAAQLYYDALAAQLRLESSAQVVKLAQENFEAADAKYKAGAAALSDQLQARTSLSQALLRQVRDVGALDNTRGVIALHMGFSPDTPLLLADHLAPLPDTHFVKAVDEMITLAKQEHPALVAAHARLSAAQAEVEERRAAGMPRLSLTAGIAHTSSDQSRSLNGNTRESDHSIGLQLTIPLFEGFERTYQVRHAMARALAGEAELAATQQQVSMQVWTHYQSLNIETRSLVRTGELVEQSRQALEVVQGRYHSGVGSMIELLNALTSYAGSQELHIQALTNWHASRLKLAASLGRLGFWSLR